MIGKESLSKVQIDRLSFFAALHDLGKFNIGFQNKSQIKPVRSAGHVKEALGLIAFGDSLEEQLIEALKFNLIQNWVEDDSACSFLIASIMHQGRTYNVEACQNKFSSFLWKKNNLLDPFYSIAQLTEKCFKTFTNTYSQKNR